MLKKFAKICVLLLSAIGVTTNVSAETAQVRLHTSFGDIDLEVYSDKAPITAANFLRYVDEGRYKNAQFYRVVTPQNQVNNPVKIEVIQGGLGFADEHPLALPAIAHETTQQTGLLHRDGVVSMARDKPGSASSEIFICIGDQPELDFGGKRNPDGQGFAAFARVTKGMDVVKKIQQGAEQEQMLAQPIMFSAQRKR
jgi:peptidyl-prolyl cis-trans isomerase A (cyclophilin A)